VRREKRWRNPIYDKVQKIAHRMMQAAQARGELKSWQRPCADCGTNDAWAWADEHRDYSDPYDIVCVCASCNQKRGSALLMLFNVETAEWERVWPSVFMVDVDTKHWSIERLLEQGVIQQSHIACTPIHL